MTSRRTPVFVVVAALSACLLPAQTAPKITTPKEALGFNLGDDYQVANYTQLEAYWKKLAAESPRMKLESIGKTEEGRDQWMAIITSPENMKKLARYKEIARQTGACRRRQRAGSARAGQRRQGHRVDRRRPARHRNGGLAAADGVGLPDGEPHRRRDHALPQRRDRALRAGQSGRPGTGRQLVHAREGSRSSAA